MEFIKKSLNAILDYAKDNPLLACITAAAGVLALIALIIIIALSVKASKRKKAMANAVTAAVCIPTEQPVQQTVEEPVILPAPDPEPELEPQSIPEPELEPQSIPQPVVEETPAEAETAIAAEQPVEKQKRYNGKWVICKMVTEGAEETEEMYFFELRASNGEKLLSSEEYASYTGALKGIETHKANIAKNNFRINLSKKGEYIFKLLNGKNMLLCTGANYKTRARCEKAIESTKRFAETAIVDETVQELLVKIPAEEETTTTPLSEGYNGKWIVANTTSAEGDVAYYFELFANNGEKLLSSEEYTSYAGALNGIETHKKNIEKGNFRITLTKRGDYIYKLLNGNGQLLCLGEHYKTRRRCQSAVESVKRFATSPVVSDENK